MKRFLLVILGIGLSWGTLSASERTILIGPKTIGAGWKDNIVIKPEQFKDAGPGDIMTVYTTEAKRTAQIAFQDPKDWQAVSPEYGAMSVQGPIRMKMTDEILAKIKERGLILGGHDYKIVQVTLIPAAEMVEQVIYRGPGMQMKDDWSASIPIAKGVFKNVKVGDGIKFLMSKVQPGAAIKLMDFRWNAMDPAVDGAAVGGDSYTYYINEQSQLIKLQLAGPDGICMRVGGKGYRFDKIALVSCTAEPDEDLSTAQRAPKEYKGYVYKVEAGESMYSISQRFGIRLKYLYKMNDLAPDYMIQVGDKLRIR